METLAAVLPIMVYFLLIVLITVGIILGIKLIITIDTINRLITDVEDKVKSLNGVFKVIDMASNKFGALSNTVISWITGLVNKVINKREEEEDE